MKRFSARSGKSAYTMIRLRAAIMRGEKVCIVTTTPSGEHHVCTVQHINARKLRNG